MVSGVFCCNHKLITITKTMYSQETFYHYDLMEGKGSHVVIFHRWCITLAQESRVGSVSKETDKLYSLIFKNGSPLAKDPLKLTPRKLSMYTISQDKYRGVIVSTQVIFFFANPTNLGLETTIIYPHWNSTTAHVNILNAPWISVKTTSEYWQLTNESALQIHFQQPRGDSWNITDGKQEDASSYN